MRNKIPLRDTSLSDAFIEFLRQFEQDVGEKGKVEIILAGGMAIHHYTAHRGTADIDAEYRTTPNVRIPYDLQVKFTSDSGEEKGLKIDSKYHTSLGLLHENYIEDSIPLETGLSRIDVRLLSPEDIALTKISAWRPVDQEDVSQLFRHNLIKSDDLEQRAEEALVYYTKEQDTVRLNLRDALENGRAIEKKNYDNFIREYFSDPADLQAFKLREAQPFKDVALKFCLNVADNGELNKDGLGIGQFVEINERVSIRDNNNTLIWSALATPEAFVLVDKIVLNWFY